MLVTSHSELKEARIRLRLQTVHYSTELRTCAESNGGLKHRTCPVSVLYTAAKTLKPSLVFAIFHCLCCSGVLTHCIGAWDRMSYGIVLVFVSAENNVNSASCTRSKASWYGMFLFTQRKQGAVRSRDTPAAAGCGAVRASSTVRTGLDHCNCMVCSVQN